MTHSLEDIAQDTFNDLYRYLLSFAEYRAHIRLLANKSMTAGERT